MNPSTPWPQTLQTWLGFPNRVALFFWLGLGVLFVPVVAYFQLGFLSNPLVEPHLRQSQTALTTYYFARDEIPFLDYRSPLQGELWNEVHEFPAYQWGCAQLVKAGVSLEVASRSVGLFFFLAGWVVLTLLVSQLFGRPTAAWTALLYFISPFTMLFSRSGLIDYPALFFLLAGLLCLLRAFSAKKDRFALWLAGATLCGILGAIIKVTICVFPTIAASLVIAFCFVKRKKSKGRLYWLGASLVLQGVVALAWTAWANHIQGLSGNFGRELWIFGTLADRGNPALWSNLLRPLFRLLLHDWMIFPFLIGLALLRKEGAWLRIAAALALIPLLVFFKVQASNHNYYFIIEAPFVFLLAAAGLVRLMNWPPAGRNCALVIIGGLACFRLARLPNMTTQIRDHQSGRMAEGLAIKRLTKPEDIIFFDEIIRGGGQEIQLYSERKLMFTYARIQFPFDPSAVYFDEKRASFSVLNKFPLIWIDAESPHFFLYRTKAQGAFQFAPNRHLAASATPFSTRLASKRLDSPTNALDNCGASDPLQVEIGRPVSEIEVLATDVNRTVVFPRRAYLNLPSQSVFGCHFKVSLKD